MTSTTLRGARTVLRAAAHADAEWLVRWAANEEFAWQQWARAPGRFPDLASARAFIDRFVLPDGMLFIVEHERRPIGFANYRDTRLKPRSTEIGVGIGDPSLWGQGLGRDAVGALLRHLVDDLGLHRVTLHVMDYNYRAIASYKACGFEVEGVLRDGVMTDHSHRADSVAMAYVVGRKRPDFDPRPTVLTGDHVRLEPLRLEHAQELLTAAAEPDIWTYLGRAMPESGAEMEAYIRHALDEQVLGAHVPFLTRRARDGKALGTTRYAHVDRDNRSAEIGWTFLSAEARRTAANTEAKFLMLRHMFETLGAVRVWLQTDARNERSRRAIERLGAKAEGELRAERILAGGALRTSAVYGITRDDWPHVRRRLLGYLRG